MGDRLEPSDDRPRLFRKFSSPHWSRGAPAGEATRCRWSSASPQHGGSETSRLTEGGRASHGRGRHPRETSGARIEVRRKCRVYASLAPNLPRGSSRAALQDVRACYENPRSAPLPGGGWCGSAGGRGPRLVRFHAYTRLLHPTSPSGAAEARGPVSDTILMLGGWTEDPGISLCAYI